MTSKQTVYWDSCVFIDWIQNAIPERTVLLRPIVDAAFNGKLIIVTSAFALAEVIRCSPPNVLSESDEALIVAFFKNQYISVRNLDRRVARESRAVSRHRLSTGKTLKPKDAVHVATALLHHIPVLHTFDDELIAFNEAFGTPPLKIQLPSYKAPIEHTLGNEIEEEARRREEQLLLPIHGPEESEADNEGESDSNTISQPVPGLPESDSETAVSSEDGSADEGSTEEKVHPEDEAKET